MQEICVNVKRVIGQLKQHKIIASINKVINPNAGNYQSILVIFVNGQEVKIEVMSCQYGLSPHICKATLESRQTQADEKTWKGPWTDEESLMLYREFTNGYLTFGYFDGRSSSYHDGLFGNLHQYLHQYQNLNKGGL